jgi:hypothetical protein
MILRGFNGAASDTKVSLTRFYQFTSAGTLEVVEA